MLVEEGLEVGVFLVGADYVRRGGERVVVVLGGGLGGGNGVNVVWGGG